MKLVFFAIAILLSTLFSVAVSAADAKPEAAINASNKDAFETVSTWVRKQMDPGGRYSYVAPEEQKTVNAQLDEMGTLMQKRGDVDHMSPEEKTRMFNSQQQVNAILAKHDNERLICKSEAPIGSHIPVKTCQTAGEIEARRRNDQESAHSRRQNSGWK